MSWADTFALVKDACCTVVMDGGSGICSGSFVENSQNVPGIFVTCSHCVVTLISAQQKASNAPLFNLLQVAVKNINGVKGDHRLLPAQLIGYCAQADVAVLHIDKITDAHPKVSFASNTSIRTGDEVMVVGNPAGRDDTSCSPGWVRDSHFELEAFRTTDVYLSAPTTFGNSGSPVFDKRGQFVSILSWGPSDGSGNAVTTEGGGSRAEYVQTLVEAFVTFLKTGAHPRVDINRRYLVPYMGLGGLTSDAFNIASFNLTQMRGYIITKVAKDSPFAAVFGSGDAIDVVILSIDGKVLGPHADQTKMADILFFKKRNDVLDIEWRKVTEDVINRSSVTLNMYTSSVMDDYQVLKQKSSVVKVTKNGKPLLLTVIKK
jgi:S1-C subfamily serine protease